MKIPYGLSDFRQIREDGFFYADKTPFLPALETYYRHVVFLRPRRFGKSTFVSMLEHYYAVEHKGRFDELFGGLWIHAQPTKEHGRYLVLTLDFSRVATDAGPDVLRRTFFEVVRGGATAFMLRYRERIPPLQDVYGRLHQYQDAEALAGAVMDVVSTTSYRMYVLIDEYDHFANRLLAGGAEQMYDAVVTKTGFVRSFYATLKAGTRSGAVARMFVTGVSPLMLDDLSSGFNIATHASVDVGLAALAGFTRAETERAVDDFLAARPALATASGMTDRETLLAVLENHYNGYRFSAQAADRVFNSDMVLYFLSHLDRSGQYPDNMLDRNVRTEYSHLQRIGTISGTAPPDRRALLERILSEGRLRSELIEQFGVRSLASNTGFVSLLYFLGMLTFSAAPRDPFGYDLEIPNRVVRELQWEHLALMLEQEAHVSIHLDELRTALGIMAVQGEIGPFLELFHDRVLKAFSNRDTRGLDERTIKLLLMTYASLGRAFHPLSEREFAQGYCDLFLGAARNMAGARYSWLLELKYLKTGARAAQIEAAFNEAEAQVARYAKDPALMPILLGDRELKAGMLVFVGVKRPLFRPFTGTPRSRPRTTARSARPAKRR